MQIRLKPIYLDFIFMLHYGRRITQICFSSISMDSEIPCSICLCLWIANNALIFVVFLLIYVAYHVTFYSVVETPTLLQVVFNSLMFYNVSILYLLSGEFQQNFRFKFASVARKSTTEKVYQDVNESFRK